MEGLPGVEEAARKLHSGQAEVQQEPFLQVLQQGMGPQQESGEKRSLEMAEQ